MTFANPWMLLALLLPAVAMWGGVRTRRNSPLLWPMISRVSVASNGEVQLHRPRQSGAEYFIIAAVALGVLALARPQWGEEPGQSFSQSIEVLIALDLSRSMLTQDMPSQTARLRAAKATVERLLDGLRGENVGLVVFAGTSFVQVPMSPDYQIIRGFLPSLEPRYMPVGGTDYDRMLASVLEGFSQGNDRDRYLFVLSDGESIEAGIERRMPDLLRRNVHVIGIGFGTEQGALVPDQKSPVVSRLTPATLQRLATRTEGRYTAATTLSDAGKVRELIENTVESGRAGRVRGRNTVIGVERFQWFLVPAVLLSLLSLAREFPRYRRARTRHQAATAAGVRTAAVGAALAVLACVVAAPRAQAHHDSEAGVELNAASTGDPAQRVRALAAHMGKWGYDPLDLKQMVEAAMQFAVAERARGRLPLEGVMHDAVDAARLGRKLGPTVAQWDRYEAQIHTLMAPLPVEAKAQEPENGYTDDEDEEDEQNYKPVPLRKAKEKDGADLFGKNTRSRSEFALGDLSGDETFAPQEPHGGRRRPAAPPPNPALTAGAPVADDATMTEARKNFAIVVKGDSPGRVHQLLNGEGKRAVERDW